MSSTIRIVPLGTASAVANSTRGQSSLALITKSQSVLLFDAGEAVQDRLHTFRKSVRKSRIRRIFITHMHGDHVFGLCPLLVNLLDGAGGLVGKVDPRTLEPGAVRERAPDLEIYGPEGLREFIRANLRGTHTVLNGYIRVTELHARRDDSGAVPDPRVGLYEREVPGENILPNDGVLWTDFVVTPEFHVSAGPTVHSVPSSIGYVVQLAPEMLPLPKEYPSTVKEHAEWFKEQGYHENPMRLLGYLQREWDRPSDIPQTVLSKEGIHLPHGRLLPRMGSHPGKKITILGDTCDPSAMIPLARFSDCLVHEATNAYLPDLDPSTKASDTHDVVEERARSRGHSTPEMAGRFAAKMGLGRRDGLGQEAEEGRGTLILNHFSKRYEDDEADGPDGRSAKIMAAIRGLAEKAWREENGGVCGRVVCARDGVDIDIH